MCLKKDYLAKKNQCKVTFIHPMEAAQDATKVYLVGDFNGWNTGATPMKRKKNGSFETSINLEVGHEYQFRYLLDEHEWHNDWAADRYQNDPDTSSDNSVVVV